jgi:hypothetical protein
MTTAEEWLDRSEGQWDVEFIKAIQLDAWRQGMTDAATIADKCPTALGVANAIEFIRGDKAKL